MYNLSTENFGNSQQPYIFFSLKIPFGSDSSPQSIFECSTFGSLRSPVLGLMLWGFCFLPAVAESPKMGQETWVLTEGRAWKHKLWLLGDTAGLPRSSSSPHLPQPEPPLDLALPHTGWARLLLLTSWLPLPLTMSPGGIEQARSPSFILVFGQSTHSMMALL